jgi:hypothetical protein
MIRRGKMNVVGQAVFWVVVNFPLWLFPLLGFGLGYWLNKLWHAYLNNTMGM